MKEIKRYIKALKIGGYSQQEAEKLTGILIQNDGYKIDSEQALLQVETIYKMGHERSLSVEINDWIVGASGWWNTKTLDQELHIIAQSDKTNRRVILHNLVVGKIIERHPQMNGIYRRIENEAPVIDWETADTTSTVSLNWPFELENYALIYPKNEIVIAGAPNAGKTAFLLNFIKMNMDKYKIHYYSSEMGGEELKLRLSKFGNLKWTFDPRERSTNFADVIYADDINIIDYIEITSGEFFMIAEELRAIFDKLKKGIAVIALQKKRGAELGRGAEFSLEKPRLYLSMDSGTLKIIKAKNWAVEGENPNGVEFKFHLLNGAEFISGSDE